MDEKLALASIPKDVILSGCNIGESLKLSKGSMYICPLAFLVGFSFPLDLLAAEAWVVQECLLTWDASKSWRFLGAICFLNRALNIKLGVNKLFGSNTFAMIDCITSPFAKVNVSHCRLSLQVWEELVKAHAQDFCSMIFFSYHTVNIKRHLKPQKYMVKLNHIHAT